MLKKRNFKFITFNSLTCPHNLLHRLPTVSLELFQENKWKCMPKTIDNFFLLSPQNDTNTYSPPLKARATAITGQTLGFTIDTLKNKREVIIPAQYSPFDTGKSCAYA